MATNYSITHHILSFEIVAPHTIQISFDDGSIQRIDFKQVLGGELYHPLLASASFDRVFISEGIPTLTWPNGADFNPDHLYDWQSYEKIYIERAENWEKQDAAVLY